jgi:hypothetical protein
MPRHVMSRFCKAGESGPVELCPVKAGLCKAGVSSSVSLRLVMSRSVFARLACRVSSGCVGSSYVTLSRGWQGWQVMSIPVSSGSVASRQGWCVEFGLVMSGHVEVCLCKAGKSSRVTLRHVGSMQGWHVKSGLIQSCRVKAGTSRQVMSGLGWQGWQVQSRCVESCLCKAGTSVPTDHCDQWVFCFLNANHLR